MGRSGLTEQPQTQHEPDLDSQRRAFVALARELRAMGAMRVRDGSFEVAFAPLQTTAPATEQPEPDPMLSRAAAYLAEQQGELG